MKALLASVTTAALFVVMLQHDLYIGSPYPARFSLEIIPELLLAIFPGGIFAFFAIWPTALAMLFLAQRLSDKWRFWGGWPAWLTIGMLAGGPAMYLYSFPLGLGRELMTPLLLNGAMCGIFCAAVTRALLGPQILDAATDANIEHAVGKV